MSASRRDNARGQAGEVGRANGDQRLHSSTTDLFPESLPEPVAVHHPHVTATGEAQLRRLAMAEECYARALDSLIDSPAHHRAVNEHGKVAVMAFANATGGKEVPGVDPVARRLGGAR